MVQKFVDGFLESVIYANGFECPPLLLFVFHTFDEIAIRNNVYRFTFLEYSVTTISRRYVVNYNF